MKATLVTEVDWSAERHTLRRTLSVSVMNGLQCAVALLPADKLYTIIQRNDTAVCVEFDSPADMNDAVIEMNDGPYPPTETAADRSVCRRCGTYPGALCDFRYG